MLNYPINYDALVRSILALSETPPLATGNAAQVVKWKNFKPNPEKDAEFPHLPVISTDGEF